MRGWTGQGLLWQSTYSNGHFAPIGAWYGVQADLVFATCYGSFALMSLTS